MLYINIAKLLKNGDWKGVYDKGFYSFYPFMIILFQKIFPNWEIAGRMSSVFFGSLTMVPLFLLLRKMFDLKIAVMASVCFILSPRIAQYSSDVLREPLYWLLSITALWAGWKAISDKKWSFVILASLLTGLACFTRMEGMGIAAILCLWAGWSYLYQEYSLKRFILFLVVFFVSFPVLFAAPLYFMKGKTGRWEMGLISAKIPEMISKASKGLDQVNERSTAQFETTGPGRILINKYTYSIWEAGYKFFRSFHVAMILLLFFGVFRRKIIPYSRNEIPVLLSVFVFFSILLLYAFKESYVSTRHGLLMGIPCLLWVSIGFFELNARLETFFKSKERFARYVRHMTVYMLVALCLAVLPKTLSSSDRDKREMKQAGIYLQTLGYTHQRIAVQPRINRLVFYMGSEYVDIPVPTDIGTLREFLKDQNVTYFIIDEQTIDESVKGFRENQGSLNLEKVDIPGLQEYKEYSFVLYRIKK